MKRDVLLRRAFAFGISFILTMFLLRLFLYFSPSTNFNIFGYNVHHLYLGALLLIVVFVLLMMDILSLVVFIVGGIASSLIIDEWVYLIFTDGSDLSYLMSVSLFSAIGLGLFVLLFLVLLYFIKMKRVR